MYLVLLMPLVYAEATSIYDYIEHLDEHYPIIVGAKAPSSDSFAVADILIGIQKGTGVELQLGIEGKISANINKILVGHPCDNGLVKLSCDAWPYDAGEGVIQVIGTDLIIAGSTPEDTEVLGEIIGSYKSYPLFKQTKGIIVNTSTLSMQEIIDPNQFICGDGVCAKGEKYTCLSDCAQMTCFDICKEKEYLEAACTKLPTDLKAKPCADNEIAMGLGYCSQEKMCCCKLTEIVLENQTQPVQAQQTTGQTEAKDEKTAFTWVKENPGISVTIALIVLIAGTIVYFISKRSE